MQTFRRAVAALVLSLIAALTVVAGPPLALPAQAACPIEDPDCNTTYHEQASRTVSVSVDMGTVTGGIDGSGINCTPAGGSGCSQSVQLMRTCGTVSGCPDWPTSTFTLTGAGAPSGFQPIWTPACGSSATCTGTLGDADTGEDSKSFTLRWADVTSPVVTFDPPAKVGPSAVLTASASDNSGTVSNYRWTVDSVLQGASGNSLPVSGLSEGQHTIGVVAEDPSGNQSASRTATVVVDRHVTVQTTDVPAYTKAATVPWTFTTDPDVTTTTCSVNEDPATVCTSGWSGISAESPDGEYTYRLQVTDDVGNTATTAPKSFVLDRTAPGLDVTGGPADGSAIGKRTADFTVSSSDANPGTLTCTIDGAPVECADGATVSLTGLADDDHVFEVVATDLAGNSSSVERVFIVAADPFRPKVSADWHVSGRSTTFRRITVRHLPTSATAVLRCSHSKSCTWRSRTVNHPKTTVSVLKGLGHPTLKKGARLTLTLTSALGKERVTTWKVRAHRPPRVITS